MKKILYSTLLIVSVCLSACDKFLELTPESEYSVAGAYKTQNDFQQAIAGVYSTQQGLYSSNESWFRKIIARTDEISTGQLYLEGMDQFIDNATHPWVNQSWNSHYRLISLSNLILDKIDQGEFTDPTMHDYIKGEAYLFRAYSYWTLGWIFGGVPLLDKPLSIAETKKVKRATQDETFAFAVEDYKKAIALLPAEWTGANKGRVTKYAAEGMLARLHLFKAQFALAKPLLADIISSDKYALESNYRNVFNDGFDNGKERVWEVQFTGGLNGEGQTFTTGLLPEGFNDKALMPFSGYSTAMRVAPSHYNSYEKGDLRRDLSILKGWTSITGVKDTVSMFVIKYHPYTYVPKTQSDWANNLPILRYTDVKMMYAEVLNEEGYVAGGEAFTILNEVRKRAGLPAKTATELPTQVSFREALRKERRSEFAFEGLRWLDLVRWKIAEETMNQFLALPLEGGGIYSMKPTNTLFAIPFEEISRYGDESVLWQNPGY
ncbi:RagB/SusD family nutrient uptake outer membrane protein [Rhabdobacter roseus]|uniref:Tetratricopeptide (TPR) repeat protein n=1 Tax=Rhabdobacter roseus TaxID=1655419 RepID=A0A840TV25_9BACT|nr:RagB/SusD family nutrient uptake outer membrane protein [Rhabdobacter roseus]MBB5285497.1 tetratricopeptide (TPR) repeat protein [Rhabdobacter roseus]